MAITIPRFADLYSAFRAEVQARSARLRDWQAGSVLDALSGGGAILADQVILYAAHRFDALFLDRARLDDLDALIEDRFGLVRHEPQASTVRLDLARAETFEDEVDLPTGTVIVATLADGSTVEFSVVEPVFFGDADAGPWPNAVRVRATDTGRATNVPASGTTWAIADVTGTSLSSPDDVVLTSDEDAAGGRDEEGDDAYRARAKLYYSTLVRGTAAALRTGALAVPGVAYATVVEIVAASVLDTYVYVADASGSSNSDLVDAVRAELEAWRGVGRPVIVQGAAIEHVAISLIVKVKRGSNLSGLTDDIRTAVVAYFDTTPPGGTVYLSDVEHVVHAVSRDVRSADVTAPVSRELTPSTSPNSLRVQAGDVAIALVEV